MHYLFHTRYHLLADCQVFGGGFYELNEIQYFVVEEEESIFYTEGEVTKPGVLVPIILLRDPALNVVQAAIPYQLDPALILLCEFVHVDVVK